MGPMFMFIDNTVSIDSFKQMCQNEDGQIHTISIDCKNKKEINGSEILLEHLSNIESELVLTINGVAQIIP